MSKRQLPALQSPGAGMLVGLSRLEYFAMSPPLAYTPNAAAEALQVSRQTIYNLMARGMLPSVKIGRSRRIPAAALQALIEIETPK